MVSPGLMCTLQGSLVCQKMPTFKKGTRSLDNSFLRLTISKSIQNPQNKNIQGNQNNKGN